MSDLGFVDACYDGDLDQVKKFVENGADIHVYDGIALQMACQNGHLEIAKLLVENGANVSAREYYAISAAFSNGHFEIFDFLIPFFYNKLKDEEK